MMTMVQTAYETLYVGVLICLSILTLFCLYRAVRGPRVADRVVSVNMICTITLTMICILALLMNESYLVDVSLVYAMLGFLAVVVLCKVYMGVALEHREAHEKQKQKEANNDA